MPPRRPAARLLGALVACIVSSLVSGCGSSADSRPASWPFIYATIIQPSCATASCHSAVAARAGVVLEGKDTAYQTLTARHFVLPGDQMGQSEILQLIQATAVRRMPPDFPLPPADIDLIARWIADGAHPN